VNLSLNLCLGKVTLVHVELHKNASLTQVPEVEGVVQEVEVLEVEVLGFEGVCPKFTAEFS
jgi:hypothetical protein